MAKTISSSWSTTGSWSIRRSSPPAKKWIDGLLDYWIDGVAEKCSWIHSINPSVRFCQLWRGGREELQGESLDGCAAPVNGKVEVFCNLIDGRKQGKIHQPAKRGFWI